MDSDKGESLVDIDLYQLHEEWRGQAKKVIRYGFKLAEAKQNAAEAKAHFELVEAKLALEIRNDPEAFGLAKATEETVKMAVRTQDAYQEAQRKYNRKKFLVDQLQTIMSALEHRKQGLEDSVRLHGMSYFAEPRVPRDRREEVELANRKASRGKVRYRRDE